MKKTIIVQGASISLFNLDESDYISLTDMTGNFGGSTLIEQWLRNKNTIEFLGVWESINNPSFNSLEFEGIKNQAGLNRFTMSVKQWIKTTDANGLIAKTGRYGGTFAHKDIAFEFGSWLSPEFKLYLIKEFQRLKEDESKRLENGWDFKRILAKVNYKIHTGSVRKHLIPPNLAKEKEGFIYANEADVLNKAVFGMTAKEWRTNNQENAQQGNMRDFAEVEQLVVLSNLESINAMLISQGISQEQRLLQLNQIAISQIKTLTSTKKGKNTVKQKFDDVLTKALPSVEELPQKET